MPSKRPKRVREQVMVYLDSRDRALLEAVAEKTGLARTEIFRRGLRQFADDALPGRKAGDSIEWLIANAVDGGPRDLAERHDYYLYGGGWEDWHRSQKQTKKKRARPR
jgi:hypothetical protein